MSGICAGASGARGAAVVVALGVFAASGLARQAGGDWAGSSWAAAAQALGAGQPPASPPAAPAGSQPASPGAQPPAEPGVPPAPPKRNVEFAVDFNALHAFSADIDGGGDVSITRARGWLGVDIPIADYHLLTLEMSSEFSFYNFDKAFTLDPARGDPLGDAEEFRIGARLFIRQAVRWGWFVAGDITSAGETGATFSDTLSGGGYAGVKYWFSENFSISGGLAAHTRLEERTFVSPFVSIDWKVNDMWSVRTSQHVLERGNNVSVIYAVNPTLSLSLSAGYEPREYRLDKDGFNPEGAVSDKRIPIELGAAWKPTPALTIHGGVGAYIWQEFTFRDGAGNEIAQRETSTQPFANVGVEFKF